MRIAYDQFIITIIASGEVGVGVEVLIIMVMAIDAKVNFMVIRGFAIVINVGVVVVANTSFIKHRISDDDNFDWGSRYYCDD